MKCQRYYNQRFYNHNKIATTSMIMLNVWDREDYKNNQHLKSRHEKNNYFVLILI